MSNLLFAVKRNIIRSRNLFPSTLKIYEDYIVFRHRKWFIVHEVTISYKQIAQVNIRKGILFAKLHVISSGGYEDTEIKCVLNKKAVTAKRIIDQKIYHAHSTQSKKDIFKHKKEHKIDKVEKSLSRLRELLIKGKLTEKEYQKKRRKMLKSID